MSNSSSKIVLVTGANKGIGFDFVRLLAEEQPQATILLGARSQANADQAKAKLNMANVQPLLIDVNEEGSVKAAAESVKAKYGRLDLLVNNAGVMLEDVSHEAAVSTLATNVYGVKRVVDAFLPLIPAGGRIVIVSSQVGSWTFSTAPKPLQAQLVAKDLTWERIDALAQRYLESTRPPAFANQDEFRAAFGSYGMSKTLVSAYGRVLAPQLLSSRKISLQLVCPGYCATDLTGHAGPRSSEQGARSYLFAVKRDPALSGRLHQDEREVAIDEEIPAAFK